MGAVRQNGTGVRPGAGQKRFRPGMYFDRCEAADFYYALNSRKTLTGKSASVASPYFASADSLEFALARV